MLALGEIVKEFLVESHENLDRLDQDFVRLERAPADREILASVFRVLHTLKGSSGFLGFKRLEVLAHAGEHLLGRLRDGKLSLDASMVNTLLAAVDRIRAMLRHVEDDAKEGEGNDQDLIEKLKLLAEGRPLADADRDAEADTKLTLRTPASAPALVPASKAQLDELTREFLTESTENLDALDKNFVGLEKNPADREILSSIFRTLHTVKGTSGFFGFNHLETLAHAAENLLGKLRTGELSLTRDMTDALLEAVDSIRDVLDHIESTGKEPADDHRDITDSLAQLCGDRAPTSLVSRGQTAHPAQQHEPDTQSFKRRHAAPQLVESPPPQPAAPPSVTVSQMAASNATPQSAPDAAAIAERPGGLADASIRVDVGLLDKLMNLVGELVLARNRLLPFSANHQDMAFTAATQRLNQITTELQERVMKTRMQPISNLWSKFPRIVRDLAAQCGRQVNLVLEGQETELDRSLLEAIKDPLIHMVRNAVDHGIESPEVRVMRGKPPAGRLHLRAFHEGGLVIVEISDDGAGIDLTRVRLKAVEQELLTSDQAKALSDRHAMDLIFLPGFSTAHHTTTVSGRGVGMDVVKTNIENIGGTLDLRSIAGQGTTLRLKVPLTLAIIPALLVSCRGESYAIPQTSLLELLRLEPAQAAAGIENVYGAPVMRLRGKLLPLAFLSRELKLDPAPASDGGGPAPHPSPALRAPSPLGGERDGVRGGSAPLAPDGAVNVIVLQAESHRFGLVVDEIHDTEEIVVKPLGKLLKGVPCFAGGTILGDGSVALILDVIGLALHSGIVEKIRDRAFGEDPAPAAPHNGEPSEPLLLFEMGASERMAIPLDQVARLEKFPVARIERTGGTEVVQYHGDILPLIRVERFVAGTGSLPEPSDGVIDVVVHSAQGRRVGLVVGRIHDIIEEPLRLQPGTARRGFIGSAIVHNQVTGLLDVAGILREASPANLTEVRGEK